MRNSVVKQSLYAKSRSKDDTFEMMRCLVGKFDALAHLVQSWHAGLPTLNPDAEEFIPFCVYEANEDLEDLDDQAFLMKHEAKFRLSFFAPIEGILMKTLKTTKSEASKEEVPKHSDASAYVLGAKTAEEEDELLQPEMHDLEEAAEEEDERLQQEMHDLEEDEESLQQDLASDEEPYTEIDEEPVLPQQQPLEPKRPPSAHLLFVLEKRVDVAKTMEKAAMADVARKVTDMWQKF